MNLVRDLPLHHPKGALRTVVETPAGSRVKLKYDESLATFEWSRQLVAGARFPYDFGFLPQTLADDGDALDAIVLASEATWPGVVIAARAVAALRVEQQRGGGPVKRNDRLLMVPIHDANAASIQDVGDVPTRLRAELEAFSHASLALTGKRIRLAGWADAAETATIVATAASAFAASRAVTTP